MTNHLQFREILEGAEKLSAEDQETLVQVLKNRLREHRRAELAREVQAAQKEFSEGRCQPVTPARRGLRGKVARSKPRLREPRPLIKVNVQECQTPKVKCRGVVLKGAQLLATRSAHYNFARV